MKEIVKVNVKNYYTLMKESFSNDYYSDDEIQDFTNTYNRLQGTHEIHSLKEYRNLIRKVELFLEGKVDISDDGTYLTDEFAVIDTFPYEYMKDKIENYYD